MEYQKIIVFLDNTPNQPSQFRTKNGAEVNDDLHGEQNTNCQIKIKLQFESQFYVIIGMLLCFLKES